MLISKDNVHVHLGISYFPLLNELSLIEDQLLFLP